MNDNHRDEAITSATLALRPGETTLLLGITGSNAHGLAGPNSDIDYAGIYGATTREVLGLGYQQQKATRGGNEPDAQLHEIGKYLGLAIKGNPSVLELLYLPEYLIVDDRIESLFPLRRKLLGQRSGPPAPEPQRRRQRRLLE